MQRRGRLLALALCLIILGTHADDRTAESSASVPPVSETPASADDDANDVAIWLDGNDLGRSLLLVSAGTAGLEVHDLSGRVLQRYDAAEIDHVDVTYGFELNGRPTALIFAYDRLSGGLLTYIIDPESRQLTPVHARALETGTEIVGLCGYRSPLTGAHYAFASGDDGSVQQWQFFARADRVDGRLVRTVPVGVGSAYCAVDAEAGVVYVAEEEVGISRFEAEPETDAARAIVDLIAPRGHITEEVKGLAIYRINAEHGYLIASDVAAMAFNVYALDDGRYLGSFRLDGGEGIDVVDDAEGLAVTSLTVDPRFEGGLFAVVDTADDAGSNLKLASWAAIARALNLEQSARGYDPRSPAPTSARIVRAAGETEPVRSQGDAADDPAIWIHPEDPALSLIIGTNKKRGLEVYDLAGKRVQTLDDGRMNNVDVRYGFELAGKEIDIAVATNRTSKSLSIYAIERASGRLTNVTAGTIATGFNDPYGLCMYRSGRDQQFYVFANDGDDGAFRQWRLVARGERVDATLVREFAVGSQSEGCVADDDNGALYIAEEDVGLWRYSAEPDADAGRRAIDSTERGHLEADAEGVAIYRGENGAGYLIVSNQGANNYAVYRRDGDNAFIGHFHVVANDELGIDGVSETDGLEVTSAPLGAAFGAGLFVAQDGRNITPSRPQNFKLVSWDVIAEALELPRPER